MTAYQAIRAELVAREASGADLPGFGLAVVAEDAETITYREAWPEDSTSEPFTRF
jgi:hypothetical protein